MSSVSIVQSFASKMVKVLGVIFVRSDWLINICLDIIEEQIMFIFLFIYNQIPPQSEENSILHKNSIDKILVKQVYLT